MTDPALPICVAALYQFTRLADPAALREALLARCKETGIKGTLLLAHEGINGTIAGSDDAIAAVIGDIRHLPGCHALEVKYARARSLPFKRMKVRIKREIVTLGEPGIDPLASAGTYVSPQDWNDLIGDPRTIVIDTRNDYEVAIGRFAGAIDPATASFRDFPAWFRAERAKLLGDGDPPRVAMYCTGGIRCEKSTAFLKTEGVEQVFHLRGGILRYLEDVPEAQSLWQGECFVFDERVSVGHGLKPGPYTSCHACRRPVSAVDRSGPLFVEGESCPACHNERSTQDRARYAERQRQEELARQRGAAHIGARQP